MKLNEYEELHKRHNLKGKKMTDINQTHSATVVNNRNYLPEATKYHILGWVPLPKQPKQKYPAVVWKKYQDQKPSLEKLNHLFEEETDGICLVQGPLAGAFVLDIDMREGKDGEESLHDLQMQNNDLPETVTALTTTGGRHFYFKYPSCLLPSKTGIREGIDVRASGGLVVVTWAASFLQLYGESVVSFMALCGLFLQHHFDGVFTRRNVVR